MPTKKKTYPKQETGFQAEKDYKQIIDLRTSSGLYVLKTGLRLCLKCDREFMSSDLRLNRMCNNCKDYIEI